MSGLAGAFWARARAKPGLLLSGCVGAAAISGRLGVRERAVVAGERLWSGAGASVCAWAEAATRLKLRAVASRTAVKYGRLADTILERPLWPGLAGIKEAKCSEVFIKIGTTTGSGLIRPDGVLSFHY